LKNCAIEPVLYECALIMIVHLV